MSNGERIAAALEAVRAKLQSKDNTIAEYETKLTAAREKLEGVTGNALFSLLPSWIRTELEGIFR